LSVTNVERAVSAASGVPCEKPAAEHSAMCRHASSDRCGRLASLFTPPPAPPPPLPAPPPPPLVRIGAERLLLLKSPSGVPGGVPLPCEMPTSLCIAFQRADELSTTWLSSLMRTSKPSRPPPPPTPARAPPPSPPPPRSPSSCNRCCSFRLRSRSRRACGKERQLVLVVSGKNKKQQTHKQSGCRWER